MSAALKQADHHFNCVVIGNNEPESGLEVQIEQLDIEEHVRPLEQLLRNDRLSYIGNSTVFVAPFEGREYGLYEGMQMLLEAMTLETPFLSTHIEDIAKALHDNLQ